MRNPFGVAATATAIAIAIVFAIFLGTTVIVSANARSMVVVVDDVEADLEYANETINDWSWARWPSADEF
jgi:uncharacterized protein (DUF3084 family)